MTFIAVDLKKVITPDLAADIVKQGAYISPDIASVKIEENVLRCEVHSGAELVTLQDKVERFVDLMVSLYRRMPQKVLHTRSRVDQAPLETSVYSKLIEKGWVKELGRGQVALAGPALKAFWAIDADCRKLGREAFSATDEVYPTLISSSTLARCGYFSSFPQHVSMVTHLVEDIDTIEGFRRANPDGTGLTVPDQSALTLPEACLSPAVCYHCYRGLEGMTLSDGPHVTTAVGKCFRYESTNINGLDRLWDFTMREVIFVGTCDEVSSRRERGIELVKAQLEKWDLEAQIETANDPFFSATYAAKRFHQVQTDVKFEVRVAIEPDDDGPRTLACASCNLHEDFFGRTFEISASDGQCAFTGCLAWGLERWVLALFTQHGLTPTRWPEALRATVWG
jgi:seryl-tRNA synthetase